MDAFSLPVRRPVATSMVFAAIVLLGLIGWHRLPVELLPAVQGDLLFVSFVRPGSEPEVVEREILMPLEARVSELAGVEETRGEVSGSGGSFQVRFEPGVRLKIRELELQRLASELARTQPEGTVINVSAQDLDAVSRFVMMIDVAGGADQDSLRDLVEERIEPRLAAVAGVSRVLVGGGASRELTVRIDPDRCAALGVTPSDVVTALQRSVRRLRFLGSLDQGQTRIDVILDGRPRGVVSLGELRLVPGRPVLLRHVAEIEQGTGREEMLFRVDGSPSVGMVIFQEEGANLVRLGRDLRGRLDELGAEVAPLGVEMIMGYDGAELVERQLKRLELLALTGFLIALAVLFLFLRQLRAVAVVAVAVPVSLLAALALLYVGGFSLNLMTLFGLALGIGMLVDNSIVVYEAVLRQLERGVEPDRAAAAGARRTVRAIAAASATTAIVFLAFAMVTEESMTRGMLRELGFAVVLPLAASLLVAVGLVPLLARRLAAPAALARLRTKRRRREALAGLVRPDRTREVFSGMLQVALRAPAAWLAGVAAAVLITVVVAIPWVAVSSTGQEPREADQVRLDVEIRGGGSLDAATEVFERIEQGVLELDGVSHVESLIREEGGSVTVHLAEADERPPELNAARVRVAVRRATEAQQEVVISSVGSNEEGSSDSSSSGVAGLLGSGPAEVVLSGPDSRQLLRLAEEIRQSLSLLPEVASAQTSVDLGLDELQVIPDRHALDAFGLTPDQVLPALSVLRREGLRLTTGFTLAGGREIPIVVRRQGGDDAAAATLIDELRLATPAGVLPLDVLADVRTMPPPPAIQHHNGRRELRVLYTLSDSAPRTGAARQALDEQIRAAVREVHRPPGFTVEAAAGEAAVSWFRRVLIPVILLLLAVLAVTFESFTLPVLVLVALPLTALGATWSLVLAGMPADLMALVGVVVLLGLTVNPAILLVDRMQQRVLGSAWTAGAAALAAVRERTRPVLMTSATTIAGLWPLAIATGRENEIWPPFATVVMGGLATSTLLTLLVIPVGFVLLNRLDRVLGRLGPWLVLGLLGTTTAIMAPLIQTGLITTLTWQIITSLLVAGLLLTGIVLVMRPRELPEPYTAEGPPSVEVRFLRKVYGRPGPIGRAWRAGERFAERVHERGGVPFVPREAWERVQALAVVLIGAGYLARWLESMWWRVVFSLVTAVLASQLVLEVRRARGRNDHLGRVLPGGIEGVLAAAMPWLALTGLVLAHTLRPWLADQPLRLPLVAVVSLAAVTLVVQLGRRSATAQAEGRLAERLDHGLLHRARSGWRRLSRRVLGLDLPRVQVEALATIHLEVQRGMVGILGPNGAGKTTLLRLLAGVLEPSLGTIWLGGVRTRKIRRHLGRWVGYLPQEFGLPDDLTAREYLSYYALLYEIKPASEREQRVQRLLDEVGLGERCDERIGAYSGGMRQRVAVARTLLRLPPVIIVDEPTVGLDPRERIRFRNLLARLAEGRVVLFSTHVVDDVAVACERVVVMARGSIVFDGEPADLAGEARDKVWQVRLAAAEADSFELEADQGIIVDQVPEADGGARIRALAEAQPHPEARSQAPTLEDGYLWLVRSHRDARGSR